MANPGDAAEQLIHIILEGIEFTARISGAAAKEIATFLVAALKDKEGALKTKGKARLASMLRSGKALEVFSVKNSDLAAFAREARRYGIVYCLLRSRRNAPDGLCDLMVKAEDAPRISRVVERLRFATVDRAEIESEIIQAKAGKAQGGQAEAGTGEPAPDRNDTEKLLDDFLGTPEGKAAPGKQPETEKPGAAEATPAKDTPLDPGAAETEESRPSEPISGSRSRSAGGTSAKPSVREALREIRAARKPKEADAPALDGKAAPDQPRTQEAAHRQPQADARPRSKKYKEREVTHNSRL
ncbi:MAG: DUF3801 domain-containing protein [Clostridium sp.]|jgi:hypothetical protein|nr:DUF3801 domain-containing protein [Clostridium sp.]